MKFSLLLLIWNSCSIITNSNKDTLTDKDKKTLLYLLEEEKLARDTYVFFNAKWPNNSFENIKESEQSHMDAIASLLDENKVSYTVMPVGQFIEPELQEYYELFIAEGKISLINALKIGATFEDLDIKDLYYSISETKTQSVIDVLISLVCSSRNHLRLFAKLIKLQNEIYTPQFLSMKEYNSIIDSANEKCN